MSITYNGVRVSEEHKDVLEAYEKKYVPVQLNDGQRTIAIQKERVAKHGLYDPVRNPHGAAMPNPAAPHIKHGKPHHALDINAGDGFGQAKHVARFYKSLGIDVVFNVSTEAWHMDTVDLDSLIRGAAKARKKLDPKLRKGSKGQSVVKLKKLLAANGYGGFSTKPTGGAGNNRFDPFFGKYTRETVIRFQRSHGLTADGIVGASTWKKLR